MAREEEIEASAESVVIADAIYAGLGLIAEAIRYHGRVTGGEEPEDTEPGKYIDGTPMR